ncbi:DUF3365 domain-containing protein [Desulfococcaceae bacterium HSG8]|nr:DUF3365 domain-containing protein [Desulfococcaceae bacterium HSG8]
MISYTLVIQKTQREFLRRQAKSVSRQIVLTRQWIASLGGVWSKDAYSRPHGFLTTYKNDSDTDQASEFYLHNPALATREISSLADLKYGYNFRVVSDLFREPKNEPDGFENDALNKIRNQNLEYADGFDGGLYRYAEPLYVKKGCMKCHGDLDEDVKEPMKSVLLNKYGTRAFGYKVGDVRGIISIQIPRDSVLRILTSVFTWWNFIIGAVSVFLFYFFTRFVIAKPLIRLTEAATQLSKGEIDIDLGVESIQEDTRNEIAQLTLAFERLRKSFQIMYNKISRIKEKGITLPKLR